MEVVLSCFVDVPQPLLDEVATCLACDPGLVTELYDGTLSIEIVAPPGWKFGMCRFADRVRMRMSRAHSLFELSEVGNCVSGGWMGSCMPPARVSAFLRAWIAQAKTTKRPAIAVQLDMFAEAA